MKNIVLKYSTIILISLLSLPALAAQVWLDVSTAKNFGIQHVDGAINIPLEALAPESVAEIFGKNSEIMVYSQNPERASQAKSILDEAGFSKVTNVGGLEDARNIQDAAN